MPTAGLLRRQSGKRSVSQQILFLGGLEGDAVDYKLCFLLPQSVYSWMNVSYVFLFLFPLLPPPHPFLKNESSEFASDGSGKVFKRRQKGGLEPGEAGRERGTVDPSSHGVRGGVLDLSLRREEKSSLSQRGPEPLAASSVAAPVQGTAGWRVAGRPGPRHGWFLRLDRPSAGAGFGVQ